MLIPVIDHEWEEKDYENLHNRIAMAPIRALHYDLKEKFLVVYMGPNTCVDMGGMITYAKKLYPDVRRIQTYAGTVPDSGYNLIGDQWHFRAKLKVIENLDNKDPV